MQHEVSSHILRFSGKAELPSAIEIGHNYQVQAEGSITTMSENDNEDGTVNRIYTFRPVRIEIAIPTGETLKLKDARTNSQLMRALIFKHWKGLASPVSFEETYDKVCRGIMRDMSELFDRYGN